MKAGNTFSLSGENMDTQMLRSLLLNKEAGALCVFEGWVRNHHQGKSVLQLKYEAYEELAVSEGVRIINEALIKFAIHHAICCHRTGSLVPGNIAVWVGVSAAHRREAYEANSYILEEVKTRVPIWKQEWYTDGTKSWIDPTKGTGQ